MNQVVKCIIVILFLSNTSIFAQNVGIDEPNPTEKLDVNGRIVAKGFKNTIYEAGGLDAYAYALNGSNAWTNFAELTITFTLDEATTVLSFYNISMPSSSDADYLVTRLMIDNTEVDRSISNSLYFSNTGQYVTELAAGSHTITVQYRSPSTGISYPFSSDYQTRFLQVLVFGSN